MAPRSVHSKLRFQIGFPLFVQTLAVGEGLGRNAPSVGLLSFVFMVFVLVKTLACRKVTSVLSCNLWSSPLVLGLNLQFCKIILILSILHTRYGYSDFCWVSFCKLVKFWLPFGLRAHYYNVNILRPFVYKLSLFSFMFLYFISV